jgi:C1A family cysteine protease
MARKIRRYGWKPDLPHNAKKYAVFFAIKADLPPLVDLRPKFPSVYDQGELGSCTANGIAGTVQFIQPDLMPSRLFIYYNERIMEGDPGEDNGAQIHDGIQTLVNQGVCSELEWPYDITQFAVKPPDQCYQDASKDLITDYFSLNNDQEIKDCLNSGFPVVFGMTVYESFESVQVGVTGIVPMPASGEQAIGGHCMVIVGYDDSKQSYIVRNSWGSGWGIGGYCYIPYAYIDQFASDFWVIRQDTGDGAGI